MEKKMASIKSSVRLVSAVRVPGSGQCCICSSSATMWLRSGRRDTDADGLTLAVLACNDHEQEAQRALRGVTIEDYIAATVRPSRRAARAEQARRKAMILRGHSRAHARVSASLAGASSHTHSHAIVSGYRMVQAEALERLAGALAD